MNGLQFLPLLSTQSVCFHMITTCNLSIWYWIVNVYLTIVLLCTFKVQECPQCWGCTYPYRLSTNPKRMWLHDWCYWALLTIVNWLLVSLTTLLQELLLLPTSCSFIIILSYLPHTSLALIRCFSVIRQVLQLKKLIWYSCYIQGPQGRFNSLSVLD